MTSLKFCSSFYGATGVTTLTSCSVFFCGAIGVTSLEFCSSFCVATGVTSFKLF